MKLKSIKISAAVLCAAVIAFSTTGITRAAVYKDVPAWASEAVDKISSLGYMTGDMSGNFNPSGSVDKFEMSKILAKMAGYKYIGVTAAEQAYYDSCVKKYEGFIKLFSNKFSMWNTTANGEISFLLDKGILKNDDLNQFVIVTETNVQKMRVITKEEASMFLVRLMGKEQAALSAQAGAKFADDASIGAAFQPYVYYLRSTGVVSGDTANSFDPKSALTRLIFGVMVYNTYIYMNPGTVTAPAPAPSPSPAPAAPSSTYETVSGTIAKLYSSFKAVQVSSPNANYNNKIYVVSSSASVTVNGTARDFDALAEGMTFSAVLNSGQLISLAASGAAIPAPPALTADYSVLEGTIAYAGSGASANTVGIEVRMLNTRGDIYTETRVFALAPGCAVSRGSSAIAFSAINKGDIVKAKIQGNYVYEIKLEEKNRSFSGEITGKQFMSATSLPIISIAEEDGSATDIKVSASSKLYKRGNAVGWNDLRIGDTVDVTTEYGAIVTLNAYGSTSTVDGYVKEVQISGSVSKVTITGDSNVDSTYNIIPGGLDPYTLRIGSKVRLRLDSKEVSSAVLLEDAKTASLTGIITSISGSGITVRDAANPYAVSKTFGYDAKTVVFDTASGNKVSVGALYADMKIFVVFSESDANRAKTITILSK